MSTAPRGGYDPTMTSDQSNDELIAILDATPRVLREIAASAERAAFDKAWPGEWSPRTVLAHLRDDEFLVTRLRIERMLGEERPMLMPFDEQTWAARRWTGRDEVDELLDDFELQRAASLQILRRLGDAEWARPGYQPEYGELTVRTWAEHWVEHDLNHIGQLRAGLGLAG
jgi:hypothetical protein